MNTRAARTIPLPQWVWEANGICLEEVVGERALGLPPLADPTNATAADMPGAAEYGRGLVPLLERKQQRLSALGLPDDPVRGYVAQVALEHYDETVACFQKAQQAALRGDYHAFSRHWVEGRGHDQVADELFTSLDCDIFAGD
jgi:hypothetical protein